VAVVNPTTVKATGQPPIGGAVTLAAGTNVTLTQTGSQISIAAAGGGSATVTQTTVTLATPANRSQSVVVTDATVTAASKIMLSLAGQPPTAVNEWDDIDLLDMMALPASGQFTFLARFLNPISGPLKINYMVG
jgi:hypothetical protein